MAGASTSHLIPLIDERKGDTIIDHQIRLEAMKTSMKDSLNDLKCHHALDCISGKGTWIAVSQMPTPSMASNTSDISVFSVANKYDENEVLKGVEIVYTYVGSARSGGYRRWMSKQPADVETVKSDPKWMDVFFRYVTRKLVDGRLTGHPFEVVNGGLHGVEKGSKRGRSGEKSLFFESQKVGMRQKDMLEVMNRQ